MNKLTNVTIWACPCRTSEATHRSLLKELGVEGCVLAKLQLRLPVSELMAGAVGKLLTARAVFLATVMPLLGPRGRTVIPVERLSHQTQNVSPYHYLSWLLFLSDLLTGPEPKMEGWPVLEDSRISSFRSKR